MPEEPTTTVLLAASIKPTGSPTLVDIVNVLADRADPVVKLVGAAVTSYQNGQEREIRFQKHMSLIALGTVAFIVGLAAFLTYEGKIDGSTFTFLLVSSSDMC